MKKNMKKRKNKGIQIEYKGYALYDADLNEKYFIESLEEVISLHDVFNAKLENKKIVFGEEVYSFKKLNYLDQVSLMNAEKKAEQPLKQAAEFKLVYFNNNLRGYYYRFNGTLFDERSVKHILLAVEKQYFKGKYKQTSTSYKKYVEDNKLNVSYLFKPGQYQSKERIMSIDEQLTKRIQAYIKANNINSFQFFSSVISLYFKSSRGQNISFESNYLNQDELALVGRINHKKSYKIKEEKTLATYLNSVLLEKDQNSSIHINVKDDYKDLRGQIISLATSEMLHQIEFALEEKDWSYDLHILYQKYKYKHDDIFLMMNKIKLAIYAVLETPEMAINDLNLITHKEEQIATSMVKINDFGGKSLYETFVDARLKHGEKVAIISKDQTITFKKLSEMIVKLSKVITKSEAEIFSIVPKNDFEKIALFIACDHHKVTFDFNNQHALIKKGLFGYKVTGNQTKAEGMYHMDGKVISRKGYLNYSNWFNKYFKISHEDIVLANDLLGLGIPSLIRGASIVLGDLDAIDKHQVTFAAIGDEVKTYPSLKKAIVSCKKVENIPNYKLYYGLKLEGTVPYALMSDFQRNYINQLNTVDGLGLVLLKHNQLPEAYQKSNVYVFGSGIDMRANKEKEIDGETYTVVKQKLRGSWFIDGSLRL